MPAARPAWLCLLLAAASVAPRRAAAAAVRCLGVPAGCATAGVSYTNAGASDEWTFGSADSAEWTLDYADQMVTEHYEEPQSGDGACPAQFDTAGVDCVCPFTRSQLRAHNADLLIQLEAAAGFTFSSSARGGLCYTTNSSRAEGGWTADADCPGGGGIGYATRCPTHLTTDDAAEERTLRYALYVVFIALLALVLLKAFCSRGGGGTDVEQQRQHTRAAGRPAP